MPIDGVIAMRRFFAEFWSAVRQGPRLYFAPLIGAIKGVQDALRESPGHK